LLSSTALILLGTEFTRAAQVVVGIVFHSSIMTELLDVKHFSTFRFRMPHRCSIGFRSGEILGHPIIYNFSFLSKAVGTWRCLGQLPCRSAQFLKGGHLVLL